MSFFARVSGMGLVVLVAFKALATVLLPVLGTLIGLFGVVFAGCVALHFMIGRREW